ncbi:hypothetical protein SEA_ENDAVE_83 [Gordonia phage EndAve]|nr:hypothetical protein SEA_ENDAVE_83 [Gordonia phage EndAve]
MAFTTHGHHIPGTPVTPLPAPKIADCLGLSGCAACSKDAAEVLDKEAQKFRTQAMHGTNGVVDQWLDAPRDSSRWKNNFATHITSLGCACGVQIIEQTVIHQGSTDEKFMKELEQFQSNAVQALHQMHMNAAARNS